MDGNRFKKIALRGWRQFEDVEIELHQRLTVITGANGAGKSSLLRIFSRHFGFDRAFLATPTILNGKLQYKTGIFKGVFRKVSSFFKSESLDVVGKLSYTNGVDCNLHVSEGGAIQYSLNMPNQQAVVGVHIDSHQAVSNYQQVTNIPVSLTTVEQAYAQYFGEITQRYHGGHTGSSPLFRMKEAIVAMAVFGEGNSRSSGNPELFSALNGFVSILRKILPPSLGFLDISVRNPEVVIQTRTGEFLIDAASGGVATLIDYAWRLYMHSIGKTSFVVTMDEPENHLHPSMQRSLMRRLMEAFPQAQFVVATHSPFIVSSVKDSYVYVLRYSDSDGRDSEGFVPETTTSRVVSERLDTLNKSSSANEILREVLGVEATVPEWVSEDIKTIVEKYALKSFNQETIKMLRAELETLGYEGQYPVALAALVEKK